MRIRSLSWPLVTPHAQAKPATAGHSGDRASITSSSFLTSPTPSATPSVIPLTYPLSKAGYIRRRAQHLHSMLLSFPLTYFCLRLQSTNQSIFSRKLAFLVVSVYHNYLLSPPSCLGMTPLCWGRSRASQPPFLERLRGEVSQEQKQWMGRRTNIPAILNNFTNILDILSLSKENAKF